MNKITLLLIAICVVFLAGCSSLLFPVAHHAARKEAQKKEADRLKKIDEANYPSRFHKNKK